MIRPSDLGQRLWGLYQRKAAVKESVCAWIGNADVLLFHKNHDRRWEDEWNGDQRSGTHERGKWSPERADLDVPLHLNGIALSICRRW